MHLHLAASNSVSLSFLCTFNQINDDCKRQIQSFPQKGKLLNFQPGMISGFYDWTGGVYTSQKGHAIYRMQFQLNKNVEKTPPELTWMRSVLFIFAMTWHEFEHHTECKQYMKLCHLALIWLTCTLLRILKGTFLQSLICTCALLLLLSEWTWSLGESSIFQG